MISDFVPLLKISSLLTLFISVLFYGYSMLYDSAKKKKSYGRLGMLISSFLIISLLIIRGFNFGYIPFSNLYESMVCLTAILIILHIILELYQKQYGVQFLTSIMTLSIYSYANFLIPIKKEENIFLLPALQSNWLVMHVSVMILAYGTLLLGSILSISFLLYKWFENSPFLKKHFYMFSHDSNLSLPLVKTNNESLLLENLDLLSYKFISLGFPFLTLGIFSGAVWANEAWGSYWNWDPKETWALITWILYAIYLHLRMGKNWKGTKSAIVGSCGFVIIWICYLGVNLLGKGLHSYGWFTV
uniref:Cytochrome c biogenesis protein CcsA n=1 Tax=Entransia fimbriata TaxID=130991 RepID=A0A191T4N5_9VIRI|nr:heme attachment to plastid cytochrome c [Entransia fimbriata]ANI25347.1 heme attachment to plastid cytochrome c [Entransia fimbriata]WKT05748.1 cytochrome c biogenesis protein [Entransia fimbriata]WKT05867.1 cytochrome c biogenesis protein [Entransia fimbriata]